MTPFRARALGIPRVARGDGTMCASSAHPRSYFILAILCCRCSQPERRQHKTSLHLAILCVRIACRRDALLAGAWRQCALPPGLWTSSAGKGQERNEDPKVRGSARHQSQASRLVSAGRLAPQRVLSVRLLRISPPPRPPPFYAAPTLR